MKGSTLLLLWCLFFTSIAFCEHPKIGLVLSGGGARGSAHIGVIEELEALHVPIDFIVGTSMGAVIGGLYASGIPIEIIKQNLSSLAWGTLFLADTKREDLSYRRKQDFEVFQIKSFIRFVEGHAQLSFGLINGQNIYEYFKANFLPLEPLPDFNHLQIPFKAIATDLLSGKAIVLEKGDLALALLASMAVPGFIAPVMIGDVLLVDGGVSDNLPVEIARAMGADILIVVDVSTPLYEKEDIGDLVTVLEQVTTICINRIVEENEALLRGKDILIQPRLNDIKTTDFQKFKEGILIGQKSAEAVREKLKKLSAPEETRILGLSPSSLKIDKVSVANKRLSLATYDYYLQFDLNRDVPIKEINKKIDTLYGLNVFDAIYYGMEKVDAERIFVVEPEIKSPNAIYLQGSLFLESDFENMNDFSILLGITDPQVNRLLGEWRLLGRAGKNMGMFVEFYQPLSPTLRWFVNPYISFERDVLDFYFDYDEISTYLDTRGMVGISFGRNLSNWGRLKGSFEWTRDYFYRKEGLSVLLQRYNRQGEGALALEWDTIDNLYYPRSGTKGSIKICSNNRKWGGQSNFSQAEISAVVSSAIGKHVLALKGVYNATLEGTPTIQSKFFLGGLFRLSGLSHNELYGNNAFLVGTVYFYEIKKMNILNKPFPVYVGGSLEGGNVMGEKNLTSTRKLIGATSLFVGADTIAGPLYLAAGATATGRKAAYLILRPTFH